MIDYAPILKLTGSLLKIKCQAMKITRMKDILSKKQRTKINKIEEIATDLLREINGGESAY